MILFSEAWNDLNNLVMLPPANRILLFTLFILLPLISSAQEHTPTAAWLLPGANWRAAKDIRLQGQLGYNHYFRMGIFYPQTFITVHRNIILNPAYIFAIRENESAGTIQEHYLMNAIILQAGKRNFLADDRNMIWNRFTVGDRARHYYRNRLRITQSFKTWSAATKLYAYDEVFFLFHFKNLARNRAAVGISSDITSHINMDITYIRQWDRFSGSLNLFFLAAVWQFKKDV